MHRLSSFILGLAIAAVISALTFFAVSGGTLASLALRTASIAVGVGWAAFHIARFREWFRPAVVGVVAVAAALAARAAANYSHDREVLSRSDGLQTLARALAAQVRSTGMEARRGCPMPGFRSAVARVDPDTGGVAVEFSYDSNARRGLLVFVDSEQRPSMRQQNRCLRAIRHPLYDYYPCD